VQFAPTTSASFSGSLVVLSSTTGEERVTVSLTGIGNTPPVAPQPLAPANQATVGTTVNFSWLPASDADGEAVAQFLVYSPHADFSFSISREVETVSALLLGSGGLLLATLITGLYRRRNLIPAMILVVLILTIVACGGGGSSGGDDVPTADDETEEPAEVQSTTVSGLIPGTTYYWKMIARDIQGAETQSAVRTIVVQ
jgi:hypothetical protein